MISSFDLSMQWSSPGGKSNNLPFRTKGVIYDSRVVYGDDTSATTISLFVLKGKFLLFPPGAGTTA